MEGAGVVARQAAHELIDIGRVLALQPAGGGEAAYGFGHVVHIVKVPAYHVWDVGYPAVEGRLVPRTVVAAGRQSRDRCLQHDESAESVHIVCNLEYSSVRHMCSPAPRKPPGWQE